jgi:branched-chain amino acid transport system substrate-binding protein
VLSTAVALAISCASLVAIDLASSAPASAASATPVVVADICSCTGPLASTAVQTTPTLQAWASYVNAHGGLNGHPVKLIVNDDQTNPSTAQSDVQKDIANDHAVAIIDNSEVAAAFTAEAASAGVPIFGGLYDDLYNNLDVFTPGTTLNYGAAGQVVYMADKHYKNFAVFYCVEAASCSQIASVDKALGQQYGVPLVYDAGISYSAPNYTAQCLAAKAAGPPQVLTVGDSGQITETVAEDCAQQNWSPLEFIDTTLESFTTLKEFQGAIGSQSLVPYFIHNAATKAFWAAIDKYQPSLPTTVSLNFGQGAMVAWSYGALLQEALKVAAPSRTAVVTGAVIKKGLYNLPAGYDVGGLAPQTIHFTKGKLANFSCAYYIAIKNHQYVWANNEKPLCAYLMKPGSISGSPFLEPKRTHDADDPPSK